jgi:hypothetical protein
MRMLAFGQPEPRRKVRQPGPRPMSTRPCPASTMDATIGQVPDSACPAVSGRTRSPPSARQPNRKRCGQGNGRTARKAFGHPRSPRPQGGPPGHAEPSPVGPAFAAWQPRSVPRWQHCQRDRYHGSDQAAAWCRSSVQAAPRRTALLGSFRVESRWSGEASSVMTSAQADAGASVGGNAGIVRGWWTDWVGRGVNEQPLVADSQLPWTYGRDRQDPWVGRVLNYESSTGDSGRPSDRSGMAGVAGHRADP